MPDATELVSSADLKVYLQITSSTYDTILASIKASVEQWVKNYLDDDILITTRTEYYDGTGTDKLWVRHYPVNSVTTIHDDTERTYAAASLITDHLITDAENYKEGLLELDDESFTAGQKNIKVVYITGHSVIPADLAHAVKLICSAQYLKHDKKMVGMTSLSAGEMNITLDRGWAAQSMSIPAEAQEILDLYKRPRL